MNTVLLKRIGITISILVIGAFAVWEIQALKNKTPNWVTETVSRGEVSNIVSVSGVVKAENTASLSFPSNGIVNEIFVQEGDTVLPGQILATLEQSGLKAERQDLEAALHIAEANRDELLNGPRSEARDVTNITVAIAQENLARVKAEEEKKVSNAYRTLLSDALEALPVRKETSDIPPTISGTYTCDTKGSYILTIFRSSTASGHSYRLSGLGDGIHTAYSESPAPLDNCGLMIQFEPGERYTDGDWLIEIPNTRSASYATNLNVYLLATQQKTNLIGSATQALEKALREQTLENATPRDEEIVRAEAAIAQAEARLTEIDARIQDKILVAPFAGTINNIDVVIGETVSTIPAMTLVADTRFELTVRVPEIDITKIAHGQRAEVLFDARQDEVIDAQIDFISPIATEIDGVAYFEAKLSFPIPPPWLRGGLNADVNIIIDRKTETLRLPKRFLIETDGTYSVQIPNGNVTSTAPITVTFMGNNGFAEISGLKEGDTVIAP